MLRKKAKLPASSWLLWRKYYDQIYLASIISKYKVYIFTAYPLPSCHVDKTHGNCHLNTPFWIGIRIMSEHDATANRRSL